MIFFPTLGKATLLQNILANEIHFEFGSSVNAFNSGSLALNNPRHFRKRVFNKGYAGLFTDKPRATIGYTADAGDVWTQQTTLSARFSQKFAQSVIYAGDMSYAGLNTSQITAALMVFQPWIATEKLFPAYGNHDQDGVGLNPIMGFFPYLSNQRYYSTTINYDTPIVGKAPPVHFTSYHSGKDSSGNDTEPDGIGISSTQALALKAAANASNSPWKVLAVHHPPVGGRGGWLADLAHLLDGTWDLILCGHLHVSEELDINGYSRLLNVSSVRENRGSGTLEGATGAGVRKLWSDNTYRCATMLYATEDILAWDIFDISSNAIIRQSQIRKPSASRVFLSDDKQRYYLTTQPKNSVLLNTVVQANELPNLTPIRQAGIFVGGSSATIAPGVETIPIADITNSGVPLTLEDSLGITHSNAIAHSFTRVITL